MTATTDLFQSLENWRIKNARDPQTGRRTNSPTERMRQVVDPKDLIVIALRAQAQRTQRDDLRPIYLELADEFADSET